MSKNKLKLATAFVESHPHAVAEFLEQQSASEAARFLQKISPKDAAAVFVEMLKNNAASICSELPFTCVLELFHYLKSSEIVGVLRCLPTKQRECYIKELPTKVQLSCLLMLGYTGDMVGAHLTNSVVVVRNDSTASEALHLIKSNEDSAASEYVFVLDAEGKLKGRFRLVELLRCPDDFPIAALVKDDVKTIQGRSGVMEVVKHPEWMRHELMAVLNRHGEFIGVLRHADLRKAVDSLDDKVVHDERPELVAGIAQGYGQSLLALFLSMREIVVSDIHSMEGAKND